MTPATRSALLDTLAAGIERALAKGMTKPHDLALFAFGDAFGRQDEPGPFTARKSAVDGLALAKLYTELLTPEHDIVVERLHRTVFVRSAHTFKLADALDTFRSDRRFDAPGITVHPVLPTTLGRSVLRIDF